MTGDPRCPCDPLPVGLYVVEWHDGTESYAAVGQTKDGGRWIAPVNWLSPTVLDDQPSIVAMINRVYPIVVES